MAFMTRYISYLAGGARYIQQVVVTRYVIPNRSCMVIRDSVGDIHQGWRNSKMGEVNPCTCVLHLSQIPVTCPRHSNAFQVHNKCSTMTNITSPCTSCMWHLHHLCIMDIVSCCCCHCRQKCPPPGGHRGNLVFSPPEHLKRIKIVGGHAGAKVAKHHHLVTHLR